MLFQVMQEAVLLLKYLWVCFCFEGCLQADRLNRQTFYELLINSKFFKLFISFIPNLFSVFTKEKSSNFSFEPIKAPKITKNKLLNFCKHCAKTVKIVILNAMEFFVLTSNTKAYKIF